MFACYYLLYCCIWLLADLCGFGLLFGALNVVVVGCCFDLRLLRFGYSCLFVVGLGWCAVGVCLVVCVGGFVVYGGVWLVELVAVVIDCGGLRLRIL